MSQKVSSLVGVSIIDPLSARENQCPICTVDLLHEAWKEGEVTHGEMTWQHDDCGTSFHAECAQEWLRISCLCAWCRGCLKGHTHHRNPSATPTEPLDRETENPDNAPPIIRWRRYWIDRSSRYDQLGHEAFEQQPGYTAQRQFREAVTQARIVQQQQSGGVLVQLRETTRHNDHNRPDTSLAVDGHGGAQNTLLADTGSNTEDVEARHQSLQAIGSWNAFAARRSGRAVTDTHFETDWAQAHVNYQTMVRAAREVMEARRAIDPRREEWEEDPPNPF